MQIDDTMHGSETQPRAFLFRRKKWEKDLIEVLCRNTFSGVLKCNFNNVALAAASIHLAAARRDRQLSTLRHCFKCICRHIPENLPELILIDQSREHSGCQGRNNFDLDPCSCFMLNEIERLSKYFVEIALRKVERRWTRILEKFGDDVVEPGGLPNRNVHQPAISFVFHGIFPEHLHCTGQRAKRIPNFMSHPG